MAIDPALWPRLHGASVHFPLALAAAAALFDGLGFVLPESSPWKARLLAGGMLTVLLAGMGCFPAVLSGLFMTRGETLGKGALLWHHLFVWPALGGLVGLAVWRVLVRDQDSPRGFSLYLAVLWTVTGLVAGAGYWGGELILSP